jgi:hypothetical protein
MMRTTIRFRDGTSRTITSVLSYCEHSYFDDDGAHASWTFHCKGGETFEVPKKLVRVVNAEYVDDAHVAGSPTPDGVRHGMDNDAGRKGAKE